MPPAARSFGSWHEAVCWLRLQPGQAKPVQAVYYGDPGDAEGIRPALMTVVDPSERLDNRPGRLYSFVATKDSA